MPFFRVISTKIMLAYYTSLFYNIAFVFNLQLVQSSKSYRDQIFKDQVLTWKFCFKHQIPLRFF